MPLKLEMKMGDRIIINGAVLEVATPHAKIIVHNQASILRGKEIIAEEHAITPAARVYFALQSAYLFPEHKADYIQQFWTYIAQYEEACPSAGDIIHDVCSGVEEGQLYKALKSAQKLILHQQGILHEFEQQLVSIAEEESETGELDNGAVIDISEDGDVLDVDEDGEIAAN